MSSAIPPVAHFIWVGGRLEWAYTLALRSAAATGGFERVILHHTEDLQVPASERALAETDGVEVRRVDPAEVFGGTGELGAELMALYSTLEQPAARANMLRAALLWSEGGVYLDTDTITVRTFAPLLSAGAFCGQEHIALPVDVWRSRRPSVWAGALLRLAARDVFRRLPGGWAHFRKLEPYYPLAVNNAVLGARPRHPLLRSMLHAMVSMDPARQRRRWALGTHLLAEQVRIYPGSDLVLHPPERFYPLSPEISEHWFRELPFGPQLDQVLGSETVCVHWYASARTPPLHEIDPAYIREHSPRQYYAALAPPYVADGEPC